MLKREMETAAKQPVPQEAELKAVGKERVQAKEEQKKGLEAIHKKFDDIYKGKKERLAAKETELAKMKDQGIGLALLQAGATMMSTPGGLGVALAESLKVGTKQYAAGLDKLRSAQEKLSDAQDRLEETEAQRGEMSAREMLKASTEVRDAGISAREDMIKFYMERDKVNRETAAKMVDHQIQIGLAQIKEAGATQRTEMSADATIRAAQIAAAQRGASSEGRTLSSIVSEYAKNPAKLKILEQTDPALAQVIRAQLQLLAVPAAQDAPGAGGARS
jgi:hypothetical protein